MRIVKIIVKITVVVILIALISGLLIYLYQKPQYEGQIHLKGIEKQTTVYFDEYGIPHIYAENEADAMLALGYVHAQDRLWQMEILKRIAPGKLSELFGDELLETDRFFATLGIDEASQKPSIQLISIVNHTYWRKHI